MFETYRRSGELIFGSITDQQFSQLSPGSKIKNFPMELLFLRATGKQSLAQPLALPKTEVQIVSIDYVNQTLMVAVLKGQIPEVLRSQWPNQDIPVEPASGELKTLVKVSFGDARGCLPQA